MTFEDADSGPALLGILDYFGFIADQFIPEPFHAYGRVGVMGNIVKGYDIRSHRAINLKIVFDTLVGMIAIDQYKIEFTPGQDFFYHRNSLDRKSTRLNSSH